MKRQPWWTVSKYLTVWTLVCALTVLSLRGEGRAMLVPAEGAQAGGPASQYARSTDLITIQKALESKMVRQRLEDVGLTESEVNARLERLSDAEVHQFASQIDSILPGGDGGLGIIITLLVVGILVLLFIYLLKRV